MNLRKDNNGAALKAWKKISPGHIARPLRYIASHTNQRTAQGEVIISDFYRAAAAAARIGDGAYVQNMARSLRT